MLRHIIYASFAIPCVQASRALKQLILSLLVEAYRLGDGEESELNGVNTDQRVAE